MTWPFNPNKLSALESVQAAHAKQDDEEFAADVRTVMQTVPGRRLFLRILDAGGVYLRGRPDDFISGRRDAALQVMQAVKQFAIADTLLAVQEQNTEIARRNEEVRAAVEQDQKRKNNS